MKEYRLGQLVAHKTRPTVAMVVTGISFRNTSNYTCKWYDRISGSYKQDMFKADELCDTETEPFNHLLHRTKTDIAAAASFADKMGLLSKELFYQSLGAESPISVTRTWTFSGRDAVMGGKLNKNSKDGE